MTNKVANASPMMMWDTGPNMTLPFSSCTTNSDAFSLKIEEVDVSSYQYTGGEEGLKGFLK